jgi:3-hydroxy-9,10-secoandrosta-1,3,5(10)-triene-9,17-dione monooxygenase
MSTISLASIAPPEPDLTPEEMLRRAVELRPVLRERQAECEALGRLPESTNDAFVNAGFYRIIQPRRFGGYEFDMPTFVAVMTEAARGCPSSGWVLALTSGHPYLLSYMSEQAECDAYGTDGEFRAPGVVMPGAVATPRDGGVVLNGGWDYSSGCDIATHFLGSAMIPPAQPGTAPALLFVLIDRKDFSIVDNWDVVGMRGTGSRRVVVQDVFVPEHRVAPSPFFTSEVLPCTHANPMYRGGVLSLLMMELACVGVGIGLAAIDAYEEILRSKRVMSPISPLRFEDATFQGHFGRASALVSTAEAALKQCARNYMEYAHRQGAGGEAFSDQENRRLLLVEQQCVRLASEAVELLFRTGGSSAGKQSETLQRYMRDVTFMRTHVGLQHEMSEQNYARLHFGLPVLADRGG